MPDDQESLKLALALRRALKLRKGENGPVFVRMQSSQGLAALLEGVAVEAEEPDGIFPFGMLDNVLDIESVVDNEQDILARAIHESYIAQAQAVYDVKRASQNPWNALPERYRNDNREQADHVAIKLRAVGCRRTADGAASFTDGEIETLARMEKNRYRASRYSKGWRPGPRNDLAKLDGSAFDDDLDWDRERVSKLPEMLADRLGQGISREIILGVSGHRLHKLDLGSRSLRRACVATLNTVRREYPDASFVVMSSLAEGGDRFVAKLAMEVLGADLWAPLPLPFELYTRDFASSNGSRREFEEFVAKARYYFEMPLVFGEFAELDERGEGDNEKRGRQYALAGAYIVQRCHELIAIWDGQPAAGVGGTGDIVEWRLKGVPEIFRYPGSYFPAAAAAAPYVVPPDPEANFTPRRFEADTR